MSSDGGRHESACMVAHDLISKLAAIVGRCDLLNTKTKQSDGSTKHIAAIRDIAECAIEELRKHQRQVEADSRKAS